MMESNRLKESLIDIITNVTEGWIENLCQPGGIEALAGYLIEAGVQIMPWISTELESPKQEELVLIYSHDDGHCWTAFMRGRNWWRPGERLAIPIYGKVTHWMPLPEAKEAMAK